MAGVKEAAFDRDAFAEAYAHRHLEIDAGVEHVFYLPANAPPREIRLLEVNSLVSETNAVEPIDFGVDVDSVDGHTLFVLDLTPRQWEALQRREIPLPPGWSLDGAAAFHRR